MMSTEEFTPIPVLAPTDDGERERAMDQARTVLAASHRATLNDQRPHVVYDVPTSAANPVVTTTTATATMAPSFAPVAADLPPVNHVAPVAVAPVYQVPVPTATPVRKGPRRVRLTVSRLDPWSVMKMAFLLSVAVGIMSVIAVALFWMVVDHLQVFSTLQDFINEAVGAGATVNITQYFEFGRIISLATLVAVINVIILTLLAAIMAILYNITSVLVGGLRVTLTDD